ncbi:MAG: hypothetical protein IKS45_02020 [Thermoguttaceae bacterium]|nr:hypothetical protein [Thermoguttaceae bacterium]MBR6435263.1 hypothetical protein [Thermoguttaceae bacterium]
MSIQIKIKGNGFAIIDDKTIECYIKEFPAVDVLNEINAIRSFMEFNPKYHKATCAGVKKFIWHWLNNKKNSEQLKIKL